MSEYLDNLRDAVAALHVCDCVHTATNRVIEFYGDQKVFDGNVDSFTLLGHPEATTAFAWAFHNGTEPQYVAVLRIPPIASPSDAVRAAIASGAFK